jgi:hypothetical protein
MRQRLWAFAYGKSSAASLLRSRKMVGEAGLEPTTTGLEGRCSIQLSYSPVLPLYRHRTPDRGYIRPTSMTTSKARSSALVHACPAR